MESQLTFLVSTGSVTLQRGAIPGQLSRLGFAVGPGVLFRGSLNCGRGEGPSSAAGLQDAGAGTQHDLLGATEPGVQPPVELNEEQEIVGLLTLHCQEDQLRTRLPALSKVRRDAYAAVDASVVSWIIGDVGIFSEPEVADPSAPGPLATS